MSIQLSGSLILSGSLTATGGITMSGSIDSASYAMNATSASYAFASTSASYALNATSASISSDSSLLAGRDSGVFATTGSNTFVGNQTITGSIFGTGSLTINGCITATGQIVAQTINVQQVTSSVVYSCGDNIFGTALTNTQTLCGNVFNTGSLACFAGRICSNTLSVSSTTNLGGALTGTTSCFSGNITTAGCIGIGTNSAATPLHIVTAGLPAIRLTLGSEARCHNINGVNLGRDLQVLPFRTFSVQAGNGIAEGQIVMNAYEDFIVGTGASYTSRFTITPTGIATFACQVCAPLTYLNSSNTGTLLLGTTPGSSQIAARITGTCSSFYNATGRIGFSVTTWGVGSDYGLTEVMAIDMRNADSKTPVIWMNPFGGNVGIGITNPSHLLDVRSACVSGATGATIRVGSQNHGGSGDEFANLEFYWGDPDSAEVKAKIYAKNVGNVGPGGGGAADLLFATTPAFGSSTERMRITSAGLACFACTVCAPQLQIKPVNDGGIVITRPSDATSNHLRISTTEAGGDAYTVRYNTFNNEMIFSTYSSGGTGGNIIFRTTCVGGGSETERFRINCHGVATFSCQVCAPQSVITSGFYSTSNMIIITNDVQDDRKTILNNTPVSIFQICKPAGVASSASYSLLGGHLYINLGLRFSGGYTALRTITYPFFINSAGTGNISLVLGTPTCLTGFDNTGGETTSFGISLCGASNTTATVIVCAATTNFTIEGSTIMTVSMVANRTALLDEPINVFKI